MRAMLAIGVILALVGGATWLYLGRGKSSKGHPRRGTSPANPLIRVPVITALRDERDSGGLSIPITLHRSRISFRDVYLAEIRTKYTSAEVDSAGSVQVRRVYSPHAVRHAGETVIGHPMLVNRGAWGGPNEYRWEVSSSGNIASEFGGVLKAGIPAIATAVATIYGGPAAGAIAGTGSAVLVSSL